MSATVTISETNGAGAVVTADISNINFGSTDAANIVPGDHPITAMADGHSYEKWIRLLVDSMGSASVVDNIKCWISDLGTGYVTGEGISSNLRTSGYTVASYPGGGPINTNSSVATVAVPLIEPTQGNVGIAGSLVGQIISDGSYSNYIVLQMDVTVSTPSGAVSQKVFSFSWDEM